MFARERTAQGQGGGKQLADGSFHSVPFVLVPLVEQDIGVQVAIAGVPKDDDGQVVLQRDALDAPDHLGDGSTRHDNVFAQLVGTDPSQRGADGPPGPPQVLAFRIVRGDLYVLGASLAAHVGDGLDVARCRLWIAVCLDDEHGLRRAVQT